MIRPGCVYDRQGSITNSWFEGALRNRALKVIGGGANRWSVIHVDDLALSYVRAAKRGLGDEIFNICDSSRSTVTEMSQAAARAAGYTGKIMGPHAECFALDQHVDSTKAIRLLSWAPWHLSFVDGIDTYLASWRAWQEEVTWAEAKAA